MYCLSRRSKYFDLIICTMYGVFLLAWYYWRSDIFTKMAAKKKEKKEAVAYMNSLKEELKVVFQHTQNLEKLLQTEQTSHRERFKELHQRDDYYFDNISKIEQSYHQKLQETEVLYQSCRTENINIKQKHVEFQQRYIRTSEDFNLLSGKSEEDVQALKQSAEMSTLSLNDRVEDLLSQKKYFEKVSMQHQEDYRRTLKKLSVCYNILSTSMNSTSNSSKKKFVKKKTPKRTVRLGVGPGLGRAGHRTARNETLVKRLNKF